MPCPIDDETVARIEKLLEDGHSLNEVTRLCGLDKRTVTRIAWGKHRMRRAQRDDQYVRLVKDAADSLGLELPAEAWRKLLEFRKDKRLGRTAEAISIDQSEPRHHGWSHDDSPDFRVD